MISQKVPPVLTIAIVAVLVMGICSCDKSEGIVSSEESLISVTAEVIDMELAHAVKIALAKQASLADIDIAVMANNGEVSLSGIVDNQAQHDHVLKIAREVTGVEVIDDELSIKEQR